MTGVATPESADRRPGSLRLRLLLYSGITLVVSLGAVGLALNAAYTRSNQSDLRQQMETWVYLVLAATEVGGDGSLSVSADIGDPLLGQPGSGVYAHVHGAEDHWTSPSALGRALPETAPLPPGESRFLPPARDNGFYTYRFGVAFEVDDGPVVPFTASILVDQELVEAEVSAFRAGLWRSLGFAGLLLVLAQLLFFRLAVTPLRTVADDVALIESGQAETLGGPYPRELQPLTRNLDRLLRTEKANQARYRHALDSLAHSLKTPLAVIRSAMGRVGDERSREAVETALNDMQHLIASRLERAAATTRRTLGAPVAVRPVAERLVASLRKVHSQLLQSLDVSMGQELQFYGEERDLLEVMGNLLDNACKYGDGRVRLSAGVIEPERPRPGLWLTVENGGDPLPESAFEQLSRRGVRGDERIEGHGIGLTIVTEVVSAYGGEIRVGESDLGGARITVRFPPN